MQMNLPRMAESFSSCDTSMRVIVEHPSKKIKTIKIEFSLQDRVQILSLIMLGKEMTLRAILEWIVLQSAQKERET